LEHWSSSICFMITAQSQQHRPWSIRKKAEQTSPWPSSPGCVCSSPPAAETPSHQHILPLTLTSMYTVSASPSSLQVTSPPQRLSPLLSPPSRRRGNNPVRGNAWDGLAAIRPRGPGNRVSKKIGGPSHTFPRALPFWDLLAGCDHASLAGKGKSSTDGSGGRMALGEEEGKHPHRARAAQDQPARDRNPSYMWCHHAWPTPALRP
jgi:hypothetical protein